MKHTIINKILGILLVLLVYKSACSQSFYLQSTPGYDYQIGLRALHPFLIKDYDQSLATGTYDLYCNISINHELSLVSVVPMVYYPGSPDNKSFGLGNIYFGIQTQYKKYKNRGSVFSLGIFFPTSSGELFYFNAYYLNDYNYPYNHTSDKPKELGVYDVAQLTNFYDVGKYLPGVVTGYGNYAYQIKLKYLLFGAEAGLEYSQRKETFAFFLHQGFMAGAFYKMVSFQVEFTNIIVIANDLYKLDSPFVPAFTVGAQIIDKMFRPGIFYTMNIHKSIKDLSKGSLGIKLDISINKPNNHP